VHEYAIIQALFERVEAEAASCGASAVRHLHVRIGEVAGVEVDLLRTAYGVFRERTLCENAELSIVPVPARWECPACRAPLARGAILRCPDCAVPARLAAGDEIVLDRIEMEVSDV
jgi:hydrogenase nickel incorporation protein HypA/HybF